MKAIIAAVFVIGTVGCNQARTPKEIVTAKTFPFVKFVPAKPDPMSAAELVKKHPRLQKICDAAGGCQNVEITCEVFDDTGNTILRNETIWTIKALGADGSGYKLMDGKGKELEAAIGRWWSDRDRLSEDAEREKDAPRVYPKSHPCSETEQCGKP